MIFNDLNDAIFGAFKSPTLFFIYRRILNEFLIEFGVCVCM